MNTSLKDFRVAILVTDMFEEVEMTKPREALDHAGATTDLISVKKDKVISANHFDKSKEYLVDEFIEDVDPSAYDALLLPGGALNADFLRADERAQDFVRAFDEADKPIAVICHGPWTMISAGLVDGRHMTSFHTIADDIRNAGAEWSDKPVVIDNNWVSSRQPDDIPQFNEAMLKLFHEHHMAVPVS